MSVIFTNCVDCKHFLKVSENGKYLCDAFPNGIPGEYMFRRDQNTETVCNNNIKFAPIEN